MARKSVTEQNETFIEQSKRLEDREHEKALAVQADLLRLQPFSEGQEFDRWRNLQEIKALSQMNCLCLIEQGKRLIFHKENLDHGAWLQDLSEAGLPERTAQRYMNAARKLAGLPSLEAAKLTMSKAYAFAEELDDEDIKLLTTQGEIGKVKLDDVERMTAGELRRALRKERTKRQGLEEEIEGLEGQLSNVDQSTPERSPLVRAFAKLMLDTTALRSEVEKDRESEKPELDELIEKSGESKADRMYSAIIQLQQGLLEVLKPNLLATREKRRA